MKINVKNLPREEWLKLRQSQGIGASEIGAVLNLDKYNPAFKVWMRKSGIDDEVEKPNRYTETGRLFEKDVAYLWQFWSEDKTEDEFWQLVADGKPLRKCKRTNFMHVCDTHPFITSNLDRIIYDKDKGYGALEIKTTTSYGMKEEELEIKLTIICQLQQQLLCSGYKWGEVVIFEKDTSKLRVFRFERDEEVIASIIKAAEEFWGNVLETRKRKASGQSYMHLAPDGDASRKYIEYLKSKVKSTVNTEESVMVGSESLYLESLELKKWKEVIKDAEKHIDEVESKIRRSMIKEDSITNGDTGQEEKKLSHYTLVQFEHDPNAKIMWKENKAGHDYFKVSV